MAIIEDVNGVLSRINDMDLHIRIVKGTESKSIKYDTVRGNLNLRRWIKLEPIYSNEHLLEGKFYIVAIVADVLMNDEVRRQAVENRQ